MREQVIRDIADKIGIKMLGFAKPDPLLEWLPQIEERWQTGKKTSFERVKPLKRINYETAVPGVKTIIVIGFPIMAEIGTLNDGQLRGKLASLTCGRDYHDLVTDQMHQLLSELKRNDEQIKGRCYVDNTRLVDRGSAWRAGLGFYGKHNILINPTYGSFFFIGQILINQVINFKAVTPMESQCGTCDLCLKACPHGALNKGWDFEPTRCISYLTQKKTLTDEEIGRMQTYIYGCDLCQLACPFNKKRIKKITEQVALAKINPTLDEIIEMTDETFEKTYKKTASGWRGKATIIRNARILKNSKKSL